MALQQRGWSGRIASLPLSRFFPCFLFLCPLVASLDRFWRSISHITSSHPRTCLLMVSLISFPVLGWNSRKKDMDRHFTAKPTKNSKICHLCSCLRYRDQILQSDAQQDSRPYWKPPFSKSNCYISATVEAIVMKFCTMLPRDSAHCSKNWKHLKSDAQSNNSPSTVSRDSSKTSHQAKHIKHDLSAVCLRPLKLPAGAFPFPFSHQRFIAFCKFFIDNIICISQAAPQHT